MESPSRLEQFCRDYIDKLTIRQSAFVGGCFGLGAVGISDYLGSPLPGVALVIICALWLWRSQPDVGPPPKLRREDIQPKWKVPVDTSRVNPPRVARHVEPVPIPEDL